MGTKRIRIVDAKGKVKDSSDIRLVLDVSSESGLQGLGSRFKFRNTQKRTSEYGTIWTQGVYVLDGGNYELLMVADLEEILDAAKIKHQNDESFFDEESETYEYGEFVDYNDYLKSLLPDTLADVSDMSDLSDKIILDLWL